MEKKVVRRGFEPLIWHSKCHVLPSTPPHTILLICSRYETRTIVGSKYYTQPNYPPKDGGLGRA